ncbi:hypothetical protein B0T18DRAFT_428614 [Schizothecium vesticola]|uniref:Ankyrin n=1 Tax=Schizothecium vesticola TaxID=314040 RepID=A0AA40ETW6_9PEZI|nr:hypothetical protein B0T18DRAFT_428614 [Schizothecium vesticola]
MAKSAPSLENLPQELLDLIISWLLLAGVAHLCACNKNLAMRVQPILFGTAKRVDHAMKWACGRGTETAVRAAISYGASASTVLVGTDNQGEPIRTLTLYLAAKQQQPDGFQVLIDLGARVDVDGVRPSIVTELVDRLCAKPRFLVRFIKAGLVPQLPESLYDGILLAALNIPKDDNTACLECVDRVLDAGADPNCVQYRYRTNKREIISPLSTVILSRRWDLFDLLVRRGGDIKMVRDPPRPYTPPLCSFHVPIMAAAASMATAPDGVDPEPVQRCIDAGADINLTIPSTWGDYFYFIMPVLLYLNSVTSWEEKAE